MADRHSSSSSDAPGEFVAVERRRPPGRLADDDRLAALRSSGALDAVVDTRFRRLSSFAASLLDAPIAYVSLVDEESRFFRGARGLAASVRQRGALPISETLCDHVAKAGETLAIEDTSTHPVTLAHPSLMSDEVSAYLGVPIVEHESGEVLGTLCVMDRRSRPWSDAQIAVLEEIAAAAASEIRIRAAASQLEELHREQRFLAEVGGAAASSLDLAELAARVVGLAVDQLADCAALKLAAGGVTTLMAEPSERLDLLRALLDEATPDALHGGASLVIGESGRSARMGEFARELGIHSALVVPVAFAGKTAGALLLGASDPARFYTEVDAHLADEVARLVGLATENARLFASAQAAVRARDDMLSVVSHDLRNPLGVINMAVQLLQGGLGRTSEEDLDKYLGMIRRAADSAVVLVADLLEVARLEAGQYELVRGPLDVTGLIGEVRDAQRPLAGERDVKLTLAVTGDPPQLQADRERLLRVFGNLVGNALKFTPPGGRITLGAAEEDGGVRFFVADTGSGIATEHLDRLFTRFWQADAADERGAGLGLSIVKAIVAAHAGRVWAESNVGEGTTIHFWLPARSQEAGGDAADV
ncbi:MAG: ATP-binding protein [Gemmatimonadota bacterium]